MTRERWKILFAWLSMTAAAVLLAFWPGTAKAAGITADAILDNGNGTMLFGGNFITSGCIIWSTGTAMPPPACPTTGNGTFTVEPGSTTPPFTLGDTGTIDNLNFNSLASGPLVGFMIIDGVRFDLTGIASNTTGSNIGECTATKVGGLNWDSPGAVCTPAGSVFELENGLGTDASSGNANTVSVTLTVSLEAYTGSSGTNYSAATPYVGIFTTPSAQPISGNIQNVLQTIGSLGDVSSAWSGNFSPAGTTPEPGTMVLLGVGLAAIGFCRLRFRES